MLIAVKMCKIKILFIFLSSKYAITLPTSIVVGYVLILCYFSVTQRLLSTLHCKQTKMCT